MKKSVTIVQTLVKVLFSGALLFYLVHKAQAGSILRTIETARFEYYLIAIGLYLIVQPLRTLRWGILLKRKNITLSQGRLLVLYFIGMFFSSFLPTVMGGDVVRGYYVFKESHSHENSFASVIVERLCGLLVIVGIGAVSSMYFLATRGPLPVITSSLAGSCAMLLLIAGVFYRPLFEALCRPLTILKRWQVMERINEVYHATINYKNQRMAIMWCMLLSVVFELAIILIHYLLSIALGWRIPFYPFLFTIPIITIITMIPISFGGLGVREGATVILFAQYGIPAGGAITLSLLSYSISLIAGAIGGMIFPFYSKNVTEIYQKEKAKFITR